MRPKLAKATKNSPFQCYPPAEYLSSMLKAMGKMGEWPDEVSAVVSSNGIITPERADAIGKFLGTGPEVWLYLQRAWDDWSGK